MLSFYVGVQEWAFVRVLPGQTNYLLTTGLATCVAVVCTFPGRATFLAHVDGDPDKLEEQKEALRCLNNRLVLNRSDHSVLLVSNADSNCVRHLRALILGLDNFKDKVRTETGNSAIAAIGDPNVAVTKQFANKCREMGIPFDYDEETDEGTYVTMMSKDEFGDITYKMNHGRIQPVIQLFNTTAYGRAGRLDPQSCSSVAAMSF
ncbi:MAG TPA: hypothetical protein VJU59_23175 [Paraburkholderia sp.]|uniref:hypothetical protein n=1 Tax=Paraburkholderia sp. TaxID=1926495 RepID=UPI002B48E599|nr:hypothetical protein [Paraburkholderia sp.]HKR42536.1 hypothetical protein [Paraburkholderia sp.]